ncbi:threonine/serine ThrE exporter family protein [Lachnoclostridium sp. An118]|uniref:threonine/serine ThrE exporter family protein n=1 Tax=Lachnoclostridium sp. An118 TaxID=1965547 RepID=UPI0026A6D9B6|nr:threonine/serine exporter family protein [Lachnoclostridium sp. An118]
MHKTMDYQRILEGILDIGEAMLCSGAENFRLDDTMYRMCKSYGFKRYDVFVIPSNIQITVETPEGEILTQIRHIESTGINYDRLDYMNDLARYVCAHTPDARELHRRYLEVMARKQQPLWVTYLAGVMGGTGFAVFFGCGLTDAVVAVLVSLMIVFVGDWLGKREDNLLIYNLILAFLSETVIIGMDFLGIGTHPDRIMIGIVMLLISALSTTNGIREILQRDFLSGLINIMNSVLGAAGIAFGIAIAMQLLGEGAYDGFTLNHSVPIQLASCTVACVGFAMWFKIQGKQVLFSGIGAFFTWAIYCLVYAFWPSNFVATMAGAVFVAAFAFIMARVNKAPATIFLTASAFPLIPGPNLYYMMYGWVSGDRAMAGQETGVLLETCLGIALGFLIVDVVSRCVLYAVKREGFRGENII